MPFVLYDIIADKADKDTITWSSTIHNQDMITWSGATNQAFRHIKFINTMHSKIFQWDGNFWPNHVCFLADFFNLYSFVFMIMNFKYFKPTKDSDNTVCRKLIVFHDMINYNRESDFWWSHDQVSGRFCTGVFSTSAVCILLYCKWIAFSTNGYFTVQTKRFAVFISSDNSLLVHQYTTSHRSSTANTHKVR